MPIKLAKLTKVARVRPINEDEAWAAGIKTKIAAGELAGTAGGQAKPVVLNLKPTVEEPPRRKAVNFNALVPKSRWTGR